MGHIFDLGISAVLILLSVRTLAWHLQNWQLREYRFDRMRSRMKTKDGKKDVWNVWFFRGLLPRPNMSLRILIILFFVLLIVSADLGGSLVFTKSCYAQIGVGNAPEWCHWLRSFWDLPSWVIILIFERFLWLYVLVAVWLSKLPVWLARKRLFAQAKDIINHSDPNIIRIAITGSYGKSSTKQILIHLLSEYFGSENVLYNKANFNHEIELARLVKKNQTFFTSQGGTPRFCVFETGAYKQGDLETVAQFFQPHKSIITAIGSQHIDIFGSQRNIQLAKFELAQGTKEMVFYNTDNKWLKAIFAEKNITAQTLPVTQKSITLQKSFSDMTNFSFHGEHFTLPWPGEFFVLNASLAIECVRELGLPIGTAAHLLSSLPPLERALRIEKHHKQHYTILKDLYSANPTGVLAAIEHLGKLPGKKVFVGIPLLELGNKSAAIHTKIFKALKVINAEVWWLKDDYVASAQKILGKKFHHDDLDEFKKSIQTLKENDGVLLESRIPEEVLRLFK